MRPMSLNSPGPLRIALLHGKPIAPSTHGEEGTAVRISKPWNTELDDDVKDKLALLGGVYRELNELRDAARSGPREETHNSIDLVALDAVHESAAIENLAGVRRETRAAIEQAAQAMSAGKWSPQSSHVQNLYAAVLQASLLGSERTMPSCATTKDLHLRLMGGPGLPRMSPHGDWRRENNVIHRGKWVTPSFSDVPLLMRQFESTLAEALGRSDVSPIVVGAWAHHALTQVHPFMDGNGRAARLLQDHVLWLMRCSPGLIQVASLKEYYAALEAADQTGSDLNPLLRLVAQGAEISANQLIASYNRQARRPRLANRLALAAADASSAILEREYIVWKSRMEDVREAFEAFAVELSGADGLPLRVQFQGYATIDFATWRATRQAGRSSPNWHFVIEFVNQRKFLRFIFSFGRHYVYETDPETDRAEPLVCMQISLKEGSGGEFKPMYRDVNVTSPRLRSIWFNGQSLCARTLELSESRREWARVDCCNSDDLAYEFYLDVLRYHFGLSLNG